ncbi:Murein DD-endopeptidase MepM and murein hydrolase activator NlpD, contain LysM domain [Anaerovirgula multivorans]|uniref:Murein DD-endopeptidase MepM and murein hydrolase activator NlpD, contain LysM domain n=1 Tax=Anaerovirgula multivorans TaxID=312168 RepID=A0A239EZ60_9FIRM|nr:M23 family metallopeptidase [Anaerovirgula multivorans]SNS49877.1 Murein DD-endopeptidase MepM and murein hydrolase activator NlpD, contain LysM domain [Anaerovirgula multivorans]
MSFENNNNNNNKREKKSLYKFLDKQGFYLILLLCVSIVLVTAFWVSRQEEEYFLSENSQENVEEDFNRVEVTLVEEDTEEDEDTQEAAIVGKTDEVVESEPRQKQETEETTAQEKPKEQIELEESPRKEEPKKEEADTPTTSTDRYVMAQPVIGKVGLAYAEDRLVYHKTLDHWSTHKGVDIHAEEGAPVRAVLEGEVIEVINDTIMGITISLQHEEDLITRYSNLSTDAMVKVGQKVAKGQVISGVGRTAANKTLEGPLLHFQVLEEGQMVDPQKYLPRTN